ncbi:MAG: AAA family ATPase, partial [Rhodobacteraceae bacterium]|nr:AAA family ATPase [Paracoccaceae bacterium]
MKLRAITLADVRQFARPVRVAGIGDGLNVLSAPNESGKSTLFDAIQALFFIPHRSRKIEPLKPAVGGNPEITLELEHEGAAYRLHKRWGRGPLAEVWQGARLIARGDEAEAWIGALTQPVEDGGPAGLLWVRQGLVALDEGSKKEQDAAQTARRDLMSSVTGEFEALTGGKRMDRALERARDDHDRLMTQRGPRAGGPLDGVVKEVAALEQRVSVLNARADQLRLALEQRRAKHRALTELTEPAQVADRAKRLAAAQTAMAVAERHATALNAATAAL